MREVLVKLLTLAEIPFCPVVKDENKGDSAFSFLSLPPKYAGRSVRGFRRETVKLSGHFNELIGSEI